MSFLRYLVPLPLILLPFQSVQTTPLPREAREAQDPRKDGPVFWREPEARELLLKSFAKEKEYIVDVTNAKIALALHVEGRESVFYVAADKVSFEDGPWIRVIPFWSTQELVKDGKAWHWNMWIATGIDLEFDRRVNNFEDLRSAKLRTMQGKDFTMGLSPAGGRVDHQRRNELLKNLDSWKYDFHGGAFP